jgi:hypothetical protein
VENKGVGKGVWVHGKNRLKSDRYHCDHDKERNPMGEVPNEGGGKGGWVHRKIGLKMIGTAAIRTKIGIQW